VNLQQVSQNFPPDFFYRESTDDAIGSRHEIARRLGEINTRIRTLAELQMAQPNIVPAASAQEPVSVAELRRLRDEERETDTPLTDYAFNTARDLLIYIPPRILGPVPRPLLAPDTAGGLRIEWFKDDRNVRVVIPPRTDRRTFVYHRGLGEPAMKAFSNGAVVETLRDILLAP